jgi:hypothetical protein
LLDLADDQASTHVRNPVGEMDVFFVVRAHKRVC